MRCTWWLLLALVAASARAHELDLPVLRADDGLAARVDARGGLTLRERDVPGALARERRAGDDRPGRFGRGWRSTLDAALAGAPHEGGVARVSVGGRELELDLDAQGRVLRVRGHELDLRYEYAPDGELAAVHDRASGRRRRYEGLRRVLGAEGELLRVTLDAAGRVRALETPGGSRRFEVWPDGLVMRADGVARRWRVDARGRPVRLDVAWGPGLDERLVARAAEGGVVVDTPWGRFAVERDLDGRARAARGPFGEVAFDEGARVRRSNGVETRPAGERGIEHLGPAGEVVLRVERRAEGDVELTRVTTSAVREVRAARDAAGRLLDAWSPDRALHVLPAAVGGGLRVERDGAVERWVIDARGRLVAAGDLRLRHDDRGRVVEVEGPPGRGRPAFVLGFTWDDADRLVRARRVAASGASTAVAYAWSDDGRLVEHQDAAGTTRVVEGPLVRARLHAAAPAGEPVRLELLHPDAPGGAPLAVRVDGAWTFTHDDGAGTVLAWTDARGRRVDEAAFSPRGELERAPDAGRGVTWAGHEVDRETGLILVRGRPYAPWLGRWLAPDPASAPARAYDGDGIVGALGDEPAR